MKIIDSLKALVPAVYSILAIWSVSTGGISQDVIIQLLTLIGAILAGLGGGEIVSKFVNSQSDVNKVIESLKAFVPALFSILAIWSVSTGNISQDIIIQLLTLIGAIISGLVGGSGLNRLQKVV